MSPARRHAPAALIAAAAVAIAVVGVARVATHAGGASGPAGPRSEDVTTADLAGWRHHGPGGVVVEEEAGEPVYRTEGGMGVLWLDRRLSDFTLAFEVQVPEGAGNSGVFVRMPEPPQGDDYVHRAFEVQIDPAGEGTAATGAIYSLQPPFTPVTLDPGRWHAWTIRVHGPQIDVVVDDRLVNSFQARRGGVVTDIAATGYLGLQNHGDADTVRFRRIRLTEHVTSSPPTGPRR